MTCIPNVIGRIYEIYCKNGKEGSSSITWKLICSLAVWVEAVPYYKNYPNNDFALNIFYMNFFSILLIGTLAVSSNLFWPFRFSSPTSVSGNGEKKAVVVVAANDDNDDDNNKNDDKKEDEKKNENKFKPWGIFKKLMQDVTAPVLKKVEVKAATENNATVEWKTNEKTTGQVNFGTSTAYGAQTSLDSKLSKSHKAQLKSLAANTTYHFQVVAKDKAGNETKSSDMVLTTKATVAVDVTVPSIFNIAVTGETQNSAVVRWTTSERATNQVQFGTTANYGSSTALDSELRTNHEVKLSGLSANTTYHFKVESKDATGNMAASGDLTLTTRVAGDTTPPIISNVNISEATDHSATIQWTTNEPTTAQVNYGTTVSYGSSSSLNRSLSTSHEVTLNGLSANTTYHFKVESKDASDNVSTSADATVITAVDTTEPIISNIEVTSLTKTSAIVQWSSNEPTSSKLSYHAGTTFNASNALAVSSSAITTAHAVFVVGLQADATYSFVIESKDASGNVATNAQQTLTTRR